MFLFFPPGWKPKSYKIPSFLVGFFFLAVTALFFFSVVARTCPPEKTWTLLVFLNCVSHPP